MCTSKFMRFADSINQNPADSPRILVHCQEGISRSAAFVLAFLVLRCNMSMDDAYLYVAMQRPCINPRPFFLHVLQEFERRFRHTVSMRSFRLPFQTHDMFWDLLHLHAVFEDIGLAQPLEPPKLCLSCRKAEVSRHLVRQVAPVASSPLAICSFALPASSSKVETIASSSRIQPTPSPLCSPISTTSCEMSPCSSVSTMMLSPLTLASDDSDRPRAFAVAVPPADAPSTAFLSLSAPPATALPVVAPPPPLPPTGPTPSAAVATPPLPFLDEPTPLGPTQLRSLPTAHAPPPAGPPPVLSSLTVISTTLGMPYSTTTTTTVGCGTEGSIVDGDGAPLQRGFDTFYKGLACTHAPTPDSTAVSVPELTTRGVALAPAMSTDRPERSKCCDGDGEEGVPPPTDSPPPVLRHSTAEAVGPPPVTSVPVFFPIPSPYQCPSR